MVASAWQPALAQRYMAKLCNYTHLLWFAVRYNIAHVFPLAVPTRQEGRSFLAR